jgi:hypothetical protein
MVHQFARLKVTVAASAEERTGIDTMARAALLREGGGAAREGAPFRLDATAPLGEVREVPSDADALETSLRRLKKLLETVIR